MSGLWRQNHPDDLQWLLDASGAGRLAITWVNHTETHRYLCRAPLEENFLLLPDTDLQHEIFAVEERLVDAGAVPLGTTAWLAKQQSVTPGSIFLTHAYGNEPKGLKLQEAWDLDRRALIRAGEVHWLGLSDSVSAERPSTGSRAGS